VRKDTKKLLKFSNYCLIFLIKHRIIDLFILQQDDTKKELRIIAKPELQKKGGLLLSHIALQYHRRKRA
jgi:hypothetical protein